MDYNQLKLLLLKAVFEIGPSDSSAIQMELKRRTIMLDVHALRMALMRYYKQGLLKRERQGGVFIYSLSERGVQRLRWLESK